MPSATAQPRSTSCVRVSSQGIHCNGTRYPPLPPPHCLPLLLPSTTPLTGLPLLLPTGTGYQPTPHDGIGSSQRDFPFGDEPLSQLRCPAARELSGTHFKMDLTLDSSSDDESEEDAVPEPAAPSSIVSPAPPTGLVARLTGEVGTHRPPPASPGLPPPAYSLPEEIWYVILLALDHRPQSPASSTSHAKNERWTAAMVKLERLCRMFSALRAQVRHLAIEAHSKIAGQVSPATLPPTLHYYKSLVALDVWVRPTPRVRHSLYKTPGTAGEPDACSDRVFAERVGKLSRTSDTLRRLSLSNVVSLSGQSNGRVRQGPSLFGLFPPHLQRLELSGDGTREGLYTYTIPNVLDLNNLQSLNLRALSLPARVMLDIIKACCGCPLREFDCGWGRDFTDDHLAQLDISLQRRGRLEVLRLPATKVELSHFDKFHSPLTHVFRDGLRHLSLSTGGVTTAGVAFHVSSRKLRASGLQAVLRRCGTSLKELELGGAKVIGDAHGSADPPSQLPALQRLSLYGCKGPIATGAQVPVGLLSLNLSSTGVKDLRPVARCANLQVLLIARCRRLGEDALLALTEDGRDMPLHTVSVQQTVIGNASSDTFFCLPQLRVLDALQCPRARQGFVEVLHVCKALRHLALDALSRPATMNAIEALRLRNSRLAVYLDYQGGPLVSTTPLDGCTEGGLNPAVASYQVSPQWHPLMPFWMSDQDGSGTETDVDHT